MILERGANLLRRLRRALTPSGKVDRRILAQRFAGAAVIVPLSLRRSALYGAYQPDSIYVWDAHPELFDIYPKWVRANRANNAGDLPRLYSFILNLKQLLREGITGDFAELGVWRGNSAAVLAHFGRQNGRRVFLFDTFSGFDQRDLTTADVSRARLFADTSLDRVKATVGAGAEYVPGFFPESVTEDAERARYAFVSLDCDLRAPMAAGLEFFYARMPRGGMLFLHDYSSGHWPGVRDAVDEFCQRSGELVVLLPDKAGTAVIRKSRD
jgi:hypothetical protein